MKISARDITLTSFFTALIIVGSFIRINLFAIPITLQFMFTNFACIILGKKLGSLSIAIYIILGLIGLPVFAGGGGIGYPLTPTFGYIIGFLVGGFVAGLVIEKTNNKTVFTFIIASLLNLLIVQSLGTLYFIMINVFYTKTTLDLLGVIITCFISTLPKDIILSVLSSCLAFRLTKIRLLALR